MNAQKNEWIMNWSTGSLHRDINIIDRDIDTDKIDIRNIQYIITHIYQGVNSK